MAERNPSWKEMMHQANFLMSHMREMCSRTIAERDALKADREVFKKEVEKDTRRRCAEIAESVGQMSERGRYGDGYRSAAEEIAHRINRGDY